MKRYTFISIAAILFASNLHGQDDSLKQRVQARSQSVVDLLTAGVATEGADGLLKPNGELEIPQSQLVREENQDRQATFALIAQRSNVPVEEVRAIYSRKARSKFPPKVAPTATAVGNCKLTPARVPDVARLLQYLKQGINFAGQKQFDRALAEFQQALTIDRNFLGLNQNAGSAQVALKKYPEAEAAFKAEIALTDCLDNLDEKQLASFGYFFEVEEKDPTRRSAAQAERLRAELHKTKASVHYNLACLYSLQHQKDQALGELRAAIIAGFSNQQVLKSDPDLAFVRDAAGFREIISSME